MKRRKPNLNLYRAELDDIDEKIQELEEQVKADTTAAGDARKLRGMPAIGRSVRGAIPGTVPRRQPTPMNAKLDIQDLRIDVLNLEPNDIVAIRSLRRLTVEQAAQIEEQAKRILGDRAILILPPELDLMVVRYPLQDTD